MALGQLVWVSLIVFLLFDASAAFPSQGGYVKSSSRETDSHGLDEDSSYAHPAFAWLPELVPAEPVLPYAPTSEVQRPVNDTKIERAPEGFYKPLIFPLNPLHQLRDPAMNRPGSIQPQATLPGVKAHSSNSGSPQRDNAAHYEPVFISDPRRGYSEAGREYGAGFGAREGDWNNRHLIFEEVFEFPSEHTAPSHQSYIPAEGYVSKGSSVLDEPSFPNYAVNVDYPSVYEPETQSSFPSLFTGEDNLNFGRTSYQPHGRRVSGLPQQPDVYTQKEVSQSEVEEGQSYLVSPRDGNELSESLPTQMPVDSKVVDGPAESTLPLEGA